MITPEMRAELRQLARAGQLRPVIVDLLDALDAADRRNDALTAKLMETQRQLVTAMDATNEILQRVADVLTRLAGEAL